MFYTLKHKLLDNIIVLLLVMSTGGLLFVFNRNIVSILFFILLFIVILFSAQKFKRILLNSSIITLIVIILLGVINYNFAIAEQTENKYFFHLLTVFLSLLTLFHFYNNRSLSVFLSRLYMVLKVIALHACVSFFLFFWLRDNLVIISSTYHECETFLNMFFYTTERGIVNIAGLEFCRNQGLFWEPGILQVFLNILFFLEAFIMKKDKRILAFVTFLILTTYSTTGIALLLLQLIVYARGSSKKNSLLFPFFLVLLLPIYFLFTFNIDNKLQGENAFSFQKRMFDLTQPVFIALQYPLTGIGLDLFQFQKIRQDFYLSSEYVDVVESVFNVDVKLEATERGSSNSIMFLLAGTGFPTTILLIYMFLNQQIIKNKKWLWMCIMVISVMSEPLLLRPFFFLFILSGFLHLFTKITSQKV